MSMSQRRGGDERGLVKVCTTRFDDVRLRNMPVDVHRDDEHDVRMLFVLPSDGSLLFELRSGLTSFDEWSFNLSWDLHDYFLERYFKKQRRLLKKYEKEFERVGEMPPGPEREKEEKRLEKKMEPSIIDKAIEFLFMSFSDDD